MSRCSHAFDFSTNTRLFRLFDSTDFGEPPAGKALDSNGTQFAEVANMGTVSSRPPRATPEHQKQSGWALSLMELAWALKAWAAVLSVGAYCADD
jgi:hypothetical protein